MKYMTLSVLVGFSLSLLGGCGGGTSTAAPAAQNQPPAVTGIDTPKSVAVVTAN